MATPSLASKTFYKRPLPATCIAFNSPEGRRIFANALEEEHLDSYFLLSQHFLTQNEPAYCALGTLAMILNSLEMDPQRVFKGPWRYYDQDMLDCCRPLADVAQVGLTLAEFACLANCNGLRARVQSPPNPASGPMSRESRDAALAQFRRDLSRASRGDGVMALSYSRKVLGQTGTGHFSPVGAYSEQDDKVLILDVARWVSRFCSCQRRSVSFLFFPSGSNIRRIGSRQSSRTTRWFRSTTRRGNREAMSCLTSLLAETSGAWPASNL